MHRDEEQDSAQETEVTQQEFTDLNGFQRDLLLAVCRLETESETPPNGSQIRDLVADFYDETVAATRVYDNLNALIEEGMLESGNLTGRQNYYRLTPCSRELLQSRADDMQSIIESFM